MDELDPATTADEDTKTYREMMRRDKRRWDMADFNKDGSLTKDEFMDFLHPEESSRMHVVTSSVFPIFAKEKLKKYFTQIQRNQDSIGENNKHN